jgi:hypothetical protein
MPMERRVWLLLYWLTVDVCVREGFVARIVSFSGKAFTWQRRVSQVNRYSVHLRYVSRVSEKDSTDEIFHVPLRKK